ncbi:hypothetical protein D1AOALGA4SA_4575 [Olavius algarvensis Delta 1 endosymbiont]|nr:hypothetical protein D1AOALGA4SA_4575 [Olavius algarvensis Delta 1 endosymbiont]
MYLSHSNPRFSIIECILAGKRSWVQVSPKPLAWKATGLIAEVTNER